MYTSPHSVQLAVLPKMTVVCVFVCELIASAHKTKSQRFHTRGRAAPAHRQLVSQLVLRHHRVARRPAPHETPFPRRR